MAETLPDNWWPDEEYVPYLEAEQRLYAWVLVRVAGVDRTEATRRAVVRFYYQPMAERGSMTHEGAWRIAMADLFRDHCRDPEEFELTIDYAAEVGRLFHGE